MCSSDLTLGKIVVPAGSAGVKVNDVIAMILEEGEAASALVNTPAAKASHAVPALAQAVDAKAAAVPAASRAGVPGASPRIFASPLARKLAKEGGVDLNGLTGSGPGGRIVQRDLAAPKPSAPKRIEVPVAPLVPSDAGTLIPHNNIRRITGERLTQAWSTIPDRKSTRLNSSH